MHPNAAFRHDDRELLEALIDEIGFGLLKGIVGFELEVQAWRATFMRSQNKSAGERARVAEGLEAQGSRAIAQLMRTLAP